LIALTLGEIIVSITLIITLGLFGCFVLSDCLNSDRAVRVGRTVSVIITGILLTARILCEIL
jgi:hypothetical protein